MTNEPLTIDRWSIYAALVALGLFAFGLVAWYDAGADAYAQQTARGVMDDAR